MRQQASRKTGAPDLRRQPAGCVELKQTKTLFTQTLANQVTTETNRLNGSENFKEITTAAYIQGDARFFHNKLLVLTGVRFEKIHDKAAGPLSDPDAAFDRTWTTEVVNHALEKVRERGRAEGRDADLRVLEEYDLAPGGERPTYEELARRFGTTWADIKKRLFAMREELRREIRAELSRLTRDELELEEEWNALFRAREAGR